MPVVKPYIAITNHNISVGIDAVVFIRIEDLQMRARNDVSKDQNNTILLGLSLETLIAAKF